jgi:hypothetical protein
MIEMTDLLSLRFMIPPDGCSGTKLISRLFGGHHGVVCGIRVEEIENPLMQKIRYLDELIDELAKGKALDKILRQ